MRSSSYLLMIMLVICLPACSTTGRTPTMVPVQVKDKKVVPESDWMQRCGQLPRPTGPSRMELSNNHLQVTALYHDCARRHNALIDFEEQRLK